MKNLNLFFCLGAIVTASFLTSCEKDPINSANTINTENAISADSVNEKVKLSDLPLAVQNYLNTNYSGFVFVESKKTTSTGTASIYTIKFLLKLVIFELKIDATGKVISINKAGTPQTILKEADLLAEIVTYLKNTYPGYTFISGVKFEKEKITYYELKIKNSTNAVVELKFDSTGKLIVTSSNGTIETNIKTTEFLPAITSYLKEKYPNYTLISAKKITKNGELSYELKIKVETATYELKFNSTGVIVSNTDKTTKNTTLTLTNLPASISEYLKANYPGFVFVSAEKTVNALSTAFYIKIKQNDVTFEMKFDAAGLFLASSGSNKNIELKVSVGDLPATALAYLKTTFPDYKLTIAKKITKNNVITYWVKIKFSKKDYEVIFDSTGKLISKKKS